jgi:hypothetical protein
VLESIVKVKDASIGEMVVVEAVIGEFKEE